MLVAGLVSTAAVSLLAGFGWLQIPEWWTEDKRFLWARTEPTKLNDQIRLVAIDDRAIATHGRWPWHRNLLASAVDEMARAGAKTIATDMLFTEPQGSLLGATPSDYDLALAASLKSVPTVLAAQMDEGRLLGSAWKGPEGQQALISLTAIVAEDVTATESSIADKLQLTGERRDSFLARPNAFKRYALWRTLAARRQAGDSPTDLETFKTRVTRGDRFLGAFAEELLVAEAFECDRSFGTLTKFMPSGSGEGSPLDAPPIGVLAPSAGAIGFVNCADDQDGQYRRVRPIWKSAYGAIPQLGLSAAMLHRRNSPEKLRIEGDLAVMPDGWSMALDHGEIYVDWPSRMFEPVGVDAREEAAQDTGVVGIGRLVDMANQRVVLAKLRDRYKQLLPDIVRAQNLPAEAAETVPVAEDVRASIKEQGDFLVDDLAGDPTELLKGMSEDDRKLAGLYLEWWRLDSSIRAGQEVIARAETELRQELNGKLVFIGFMATAQDTDMINTVYGPRTPGVYFHAAIAGMALDHEALTFAPRWMSVVVALALGVIAAALVSRFGSGASTSLMVLVLVAYVGIAGVWAFNARDYMMPLAAPVLAGGLAQMAGLGTAAFVNQRERARITRQFRARVSSQLVDQLVKNPDALSVRGEQRMACILFGDLAGFTTISEKLGSEAVVATLNLYMGALAKELSDKNAYVNKFLGDGVLAFWSAFGEEPDQCKLALRACVECQRQVKAIGLRPDRASLPTVSLRLGVATGVVTIGDCGSPPELNDYTVIGDAANLAARLESANKQFGTAVLMDGQTRAFVGDAGDLRLVRLGRVVVVGQSVPVEVFTLLVEEPAEGWMAAVGQAVTAFEKSDFAGCAAAFDALEAKFGKSKLSHPYRQAMDDPEDPRDGVLRLRSK